MSLWKKHDRLDQSMNRAGGKAGEKPGSSRRKPQIEEIHPRAAIPGGEIGIWGTGFTDNGRTRPVVRFGEQSGSLLVSSPSRLIV